MRKGLLASAALVPSLQCAAALAAADTIKIGVLNDQPGVFADNGGRGSAVAAKLAAENFGNRTLGKRIEIISADHQNKPDVAAATARRCFDTENVNMVTDGAMR